MAEWKDVHSSPKLQLTTVQPSTGEHWIPPKKDTPCPAAKEKTQQDSTGGEITFRLKLHTVQKYSQGSNKPCAHQALGTPQETEPDLPLSV